jgi:hypothetical protein
MKKERGKKSKETNFSSVVVNDFILIKSSNKSFSLLTKIFNTLTNKTKIYKQAKHVRLLANTSVLFIMITNHAHKFT